ncbi:hypothetical protein [Ensifer sp. Root127]|uniref:hypothetical protein n=1 Tax=Ensifer sp. Root127 TaxID=1736440 RepID=UPI00070DB9DA|nr:hypothetical protein [Ensifer sp. Root127]KQW54792.1 hypothetical protein ASD03_19690 [Ensifer sp. Root127]
MLTKGLAKNLRSVSVCNAISYTEAIGAVAQHVDGNYVVAKDIIECTKQRHAPIADYFQSDLGIIHDPLIVQEEHRQLVLDTMAEAVENTANPVVLYNEFNGFVCFCST